jgi:GT2 family glycosyltransferase
VVTHNSARDVPGLLRSLPRALGDLDVRMVVVDTASDDDTVETVRAHGSTPCLALTRNVGYAAAINAGMRALPSCRTFLVLNADVRLEPGSVLQLQRVLDDQAVGVAVPALLDGDSDAVARSLRREPTVRRALGDALFGAHWRSRPGWLAETVWDDAAYQRRGEVDWATGAVLLVSARCAEQVGPWDDGFFLYSEEVDFCARARARGFRIEFVPDARVRHRAGGSGRPPLLAALLAVNRVRYYERRHNALLSSAFRATVLLHELLRCGQLAHRHALTTLTQRSRWSALTASLSGAPR